MNLYDIALHIFLKRTSGGYVNDATKNGFKSEIRSCIELAKLFQEMCEEDTAAQKVSGIHERIPEDGQ